MAKPSRSRASQPKPNPRPSRTGATGAAASVKATTPGEAVRHKGVRWHRAPTGVVRWWNEDLNQWVRWRPGADAPPRPPGWEPGGGGGPATNKTARAGWRSPYRWAPVALIAFIVVIGLIQATSGSGGQDSAETKASAKLAGQCLHQNGTAAGHPRYSATAVACGSPQASVKVVRVLPGTPGAPACGPGETGLSLPYPGVRYPHVECVVPAGG
jgi:hypothetical protein